MSFENLPGFPENYRPVRVDRLTRGTKYLDDGNIAEWNSITESIAKYLIVEEIKPEPKPTEILQVTTSDGFQLGDWVMLNKNVGIIEKFSENLPTLVSCLRFFYRDGTTFTTTARTCELQLVAFRPFANGDEFKPYRDWWIEAKIAHSVFKSCWKVLDYDTETATTLAKNQIHYVTYEKAFDHWKFENGHPFGCPVPAV